MKKDTLNELICRLQSGDQSAATELYESTREDLHYYILKTVNDRFLAEDLLQDTYMEIFQTIHKLTAPEAYVTWSRQVAYHRCTAYFRKRHELLADENEDGQTVFDTLAEDREEFIPDQALEKEELKKTISQMIDQLPEEQRSALVLRYFDELSLADIAKVQNVPENTVKSRLSYGRKAIRKSVEDYEQKNGVRLHSVAILPLLLWFFREQTKATGGSLTAKGVATATAAKSVAAEAGKVAAGAKIKATAAAGTKIAGKVAAKRLVAGVVATLITAGSITTGVIVNKKGDENTLNPYALTTQQGTNPVNDTSDPENTPETVDPAEPVPVYIFTSISRVEEDGQLTLVLDRTFDENNNILTQTTYHDNNYTTTEQYTYNKDNQLILKNINDGLYIHTYTYHENGNLHVHEYSYAYTSAPVKYRTQTKTYDERGNLTEILVNEIDGSVLYRDSYTYNRQNLLVERVYEYPESNKDIYTYAYDSQGRTTEEGYIRYGGKADNYAVNNEWKKTYTYDKDGNLVKLVTYSKSGREKTTVETFDADGNPLTFNSIIDGSPVGDNEYVYENGHLSHIIYRHNNQETSRLVYDYTDGNLSEIYKTEDGERKVFYRFSYDGDGNLTESEHYYYGALSNRRTYSYDSSGIKVNCYDPAGELIYYYHYSNGEFLEEMRYRDGILGNHIRYTYDSNGNLTESYRYSSQGPGDGEILISFYDENIEEDFLEPYITKEIPTCSKPGSKNNEQINTYAYDQSGRQISHTITENGTVVASETHTYDEEGRLIGYSNNGVEYVAQQTEIYIPNHSLEELVDGYDVYFSGTHYIEDIPNF